MVVAIVTEAWKLAAGCAAASKAAAAAAAQEVPVLLYPPSQAAKAKKPAPFRGVLSSSKCQDRRDAGAVAVVVGRRRAMASCLLAALAAASSSLSGAAQAAILEADDDIELLERVKEDKKKRLQKQGDHQLLSHRDRRRSAGMEGLTASEIAGFGVGALLLGATIAAYRVDGFIAASQRRSLSMCKRCGDLRMVACSQCKGVGSVRKGIFTFGMLGDIYESLGAETKATDLVACSKCRSKGRLSCPECSMVR